MFIYPWVLMISGLIAGIILFLRYKTMNQIIESDEEDIDFKVSVIIPARNEGHNIGNLLTALKNSQYPIHEIICVNDGSTDHTQEVIEEFNVKILNLNKPHDGWRGKTWACQTGAYEATGTYLIFIDADVTLSPNSIGKLVSAYKKYKTPISIQPYHRVEKFYEYISMIFNFVQIAATGLSVVGYKKTAGFYGPVLMIEKKLFLDRGGYQSVKDKVVEDYLLGRTYNKDGIYFQLYMGYLDVTFRMYPLGFKQVVEGWSKNFSKAASNSDVLLFTLIFIWLTAITALPFYLIEWALDGSYWFLLFGSLVYIGNAVIMTVVGKKIGSYPLWTFLIFPIYVIAFHLIFIYSIWTSLIMKNSTWKGRKL